MLDVIDLFGERSTVDELGLGTVRDVFADKLFPGLARVRSKPAQSTSFLSPGSTRPSKANESHPRSSRSEVERNVFSVIQMDLFGIWGFKAGILAYQLTNCIRINFCKVEPKFGERSASYILPKFAIAF